jgi:hypothetical protein
MAADQARSSITVAAEPAAIMDVIADFPAYPEWAGPVQRIEVVDPGTGGRANRVRFWVDAKLFQDEYVLDYDWQGQRRVDWWLIEGKTQKSQRGSYILEPRGAVTEVTYDLAVELKVAFPGFLRRKAQSSVMDTALKDLKKRVEGR